MESTYLRTVFLEIPSSLVFSVNCFCRPVASPENVTEIPALISHP